MNVLSLFDGMSGARLALDRAGVEVGNYFASEIDKPAIKVTMSNYTDTIQLGDINNYKSWDLPKINLAVAGSPCQDLTRIKGKEAEGLHGEKSKLFFRFVEVLHRCKPDYFLLENVVMNKESEDTITAILGVDTIEINSSHFSAQDRPRLYWTNIEFDKELPINNTVFSDVMEKEIDPVHWLDDDFEKFYGLDKRQVGTLYPEYPNGKMKYTETTSRVYNPNFKMACLTAVSGGGQHKKVFHNGKPRRLTPIEYERLQRVPDNYTAVAAMGQRYKMLGNGFTVDAVAHILKGLK
jgi:DNA-cytosine methyltransferase